MLSREENETLCRVGPDRPMGKVLRRYWTPAFLAGDLPAPDCPPMGVTVLGEDFVAFRDSSGRLGFLDELCCHRGAPLSYGRAEEGGLRCLYHGWKYDVEGRILEAPNCENPYILERVRQGSYPVREAAGLGWVYLGPKEHQPPFPHFRWMDGEVSVSEAVFDCNWVQIQEGSLDSSHIGLLHLDTAVGMRPGPRWIGSSYFEGVPWEEGGYGSSAMRSDVPTKDNAPAIHVADTPFGFQYAAVRRMDDDDPTKKHVRISALAFPYAAHIANSGGSGALLVVPRDDESCSFISVSGPGRRGSRAPTPASDTPVHPETREVRFPQDTRRFKVPPQHRAAMSARKSFAGFPGGNRPQDAAVQGVNTKRPINSRATEHLVAADGACLRFRRLLLESLKRVESGQPPVALGEGYDFRNLQSYSGIADVDAGWEDLVPGNACKGPLPIRLAAPARA